MIAASRLAAAATVAALGVALTLAAQAAPASAADQQAGALISLDGVHFSAAPEGSLFPSGVVLIPGATAQATIWVRNASAAAADLRIAVADATSTTEAFIRSLTLQATTTATPAGAPVPLGADGDCLPLLTGEVIDPGATTEVHLALVLAQAADNAGQGSSAGAELAVSLADATTGVALPPNCDVASGVPVLAGSSGSSSGTTSTRSATDQPGTAAAAAPGSDPTASALSGGPAAAALPTLPFGDHPAFYPALLGGALVLGAGGAALFFAIRKRRENA